MNFISDFKMLLWRKLKLPLYKLKVLKYYKNNPEASRYSIHLEYLRNNKVSNILGNYLNKYKSYEVQVFIDPMNQLPYVLHQNKKLYFVKGLTKKQVKAKYIELLSEQDPDSAHCYQDPEFQVKVGEVLFDIGAAEGIIALSEIENIKKAYLFEYDERWIEALNNTFAPWKDKVEIVPKYVSDTNDKVSVTLDEFIISNKIKPDFIKIDVEGFERKVLKGMNNILYSKDPVKIALCTYHNFNDTEEFEKLLTLHNFNIKFSKGYMLFHKNTKTVKPPFFIRGVIRARKD